jgi:Na+/H+ antiporter NhaD/arsenite permease-like protein
VLAVLGLSVVAFAAGTDLAWTAAAGLAALLVLRRDVPGEEVWRRVDLGILLFFAGLFVVVEGLVATGAPAAVFARFPLLPHADALGWARLAGLFLVGSNVVSNVPFILVVRDAMGTLPDPRLGWELLAVASTFAGNLTLLGSVANVIVAEGGRPVGGLSFGEHLRVGAPIALATTALGAAWLWAFG